MRPELSAKTILPKITHSATPTNQRSIPGQRVLENPRVFPVALLVPVLIFFIILNVVPTLWMVGLGFYRYSLTAGTPPSYIGLNNFVDIYKSVDVWRTLGRTFTFSALSVSME